VAHDALAESTALIAHGLPEVPPRLSRRRRSAALGVDGDVAGTLFVVRGPGHFRFETHALARRDGTWALLGGGGHGRDDDGLTDRPPARDLGCPVVVGGGGSVALGGGFLPWGGRCVRDATLRAAAEVVTVAVGPACWRSVLSRSRAVRRPNPSAAPARAAPPPRRAGS
jgi:hypothetical protein